MLNEMSPSKLLVVYGHVGFDMSTYASGTTRTVGGSAYYASMAAATLGIETSLVTVFGSDFPEHQLSHKRLHTTHSLRRRGPSAVFTQRYDDSNEVCSFDGALNVCSRLNPKNIPLVVRSETPEAVVHSGCERLSLIGPAERLGQRAIEEGDEIADTLLQILHRREVASA